jgi:hypothetical protein
MTRRWEKVTAIAGILTAVMLLAELFTWSNPQLTDSMSKIKDYFVQNSALASVSIWLAAMLTMPLFIFAAGLRSALRREDGAADALPAIFLAAAAAFASVQLVFGAVSGALVLAAPRATDGEVRLMLSALDFLDALRFMPFAVMTGAMALAMLDGRRFRRWIGWVGVASAVLNLAGELSLLDFYGPIGNIGNISQVGFLLFLVWVVAVGVSLLRRQPNARQPTPIGQVNPPLT